MGIEQHQQATTEVYNPLQIESGPKPIVISKEEDLISIKPEDRIVHLTTQRVVSRKMIDRIALEHPNIDVIQIPPSLFAFKIAFMVDLAPYEERGITFQIKRIRESSDFRRSPDRKYDEKKQAFLEALKDPERQSKLVRMLQYGRELFPEPYLAIRYFCGVNGIPRDMIHDTEATIRYLLYSAEEYANEHPASLVSLVFELRTSYRQIELFYQRMIYWSGYPTKIMQSRGGARRLASRLRNQDAIFEKQQRAEQYRVGNLLPPLDLDEDRWIIWQRTMQMYVNDEASLRDFFKEHPALYVPFAAYYRLWPYRTVEVKTSEIAATEGISNSGISSRRKRALIGLGLIQES